MMCIAVKSDALSDWWTIERAEHDGREWEEDGDAQGFSSFRWCRSARLEPYTCIEGTSAEMLALAEVIEEGSEAHFKHCAVETTTDGVLLWSPRNSNGRKTLISRNDALLLAADIRSKVRP